MAIIRKRMPQACPTCQSLLKVSRLTCLKCETVVEGLFELPILARLPAEDQEFIFHFTLVSGSLKKMAQLMKLSYPTIRNRLDGIIKRCGENIHAPTQPVSGETPDRR